MKWYCTVKQSEFAGGFKKGVLYIYKTNNEGDTQAFNGKTWEWIDINKFELLHTL